MMGLNQMMSGDCPLPSIEIEARCSKGCNAHYLTTENPDRFRQQAQIFLHEPVDVEKITLG